MKPSFEEYLNSSFFQVYIGKFLFLKIPSQSSFLKDLQIFHVLALKVSVSLDVIFTKPVNC